METSPHPLSRPSSHARLLFATLPTQIQRGYRAQPRPPEAATPHNLPLYPCTHMCPETMTATSASMKEGGGNPLRPSLPLWDRMKRANNLPTVHRRQGQALQVIPSTDLRSPVTSPPHGPAVRICSLAPLQQSQIERITTLRGRDGRILMRSWTLWIQLKSAGYICKASSPLSLAYRVSDADAHIHVFRSDIDREQCS